MGTCVACGSVRSSWEDPGNPVPERKDRNRNGLPHIAAITGRYHEASSFRTVDPPATLIVSGMLFVPSGTVDAGISDHCQVPPYVVQNIPPNVLILFDVSGACRPIAYSEGTRLRPTRRTTTPAPAPIGARSTTTLGRLASHRYYGYFDPDQWYTYGSNVFTAVGPRTATNPDHYWSGDFLNWLTMRRIDIMRKVLIGGTAERQQD